MIKATITLHYEWPDEFGQTPQSIEHWLVDAKRDLIRKLAAADYLAPEDITTTVEEVDS